MGSDSTTPNPTTRDTALTEARDCALAIIKLATGRPSSGALLLAWDYRSAFRKLHEDMLGPLIAEDARLIGLAVALLRAAYDVEKKSHLDSSHRRNYAARLEDAGRASTWATSYVLRINQRARSAMVVASADVLAVRPAAPIGEHMTRDVIQQAFDAASDETFSMPSSAPRAPKDRRKPTSIYERVAGRPRQIATKVSVRF